jgi:hypothetical protein
MKVGELTLGVAGGRSGVVLAASSIDISKRQGRQQEEFSEKEFSVIYWQSGVPGRWLTLGNFPVASSICLLWSLMSSWMPEYVLE